MKTTKESFEKTEKQTESFISFSSSLSLSLTTPFLPNLSLFFSSVSSALLFNSLSVSGVSLPNEANQPGKTLHRRGCRNIPPFLMTKPFCSLVLSVVFVLIFFFPPATDALGSAYTVAVIYGTGTVCGIVAAQPIQRIVCYQRGAIVPIEPNISFSSISGGENFFCGVRSGGNSLLCWDTTSFSNISNFRPKRIYYNDTVSLKNLSVGDNQICATTSDGSIQSWRGNTSSSGRIRPNEVKFKSISSGIGFSCGILVNTRRIRCWGSDKIADRIQNRFGNQLLLTITAGGSHVCGINSTGFLICHGDNESNQLNFPPHSAFEYQSLSLGLAHTCALKLNGSAVCWGGGGNFTGDEIQSVSFESIVSGSSFSCGLTTINFSIICWGPGWNTDYNSTNSGFSSIQFPQILPGICVQSSCECGIYPESARLCVGSGSICKSCLIPNFTNPSPSSIPPPPPPPSIPRSPQSNKLATRLLIFAIVGSVGAFAGICTLIYCLYTGVCFKHKKVHNSVQPTITRGGSNNGGSSNHSPPSRSSTIKRQGSRLIMRRQRSGTSGKHTDRAEEFYLSELAIATNNFSIENKIGAGSFGVVYKGKLSDGREVAIKRGETGQIKKKFQEKETAFDSELSFLSRLHHKNLVRLVGYCEERDERLLVYEYMKNGALYDHLHDKNNVEKSSNVIINSWKMRIKLALDASRGIEYLHNYAVPTIIHRDIKSSNILIDANWTARVSDFGLSMMGPEPEHENQPVKAAGTVGYIDPEYYGLNVLTAKSDVYGFGVVLLELLTGKKAIFRDESENGETPVSLVDFAVPVIMAEELVKILDKRVGLPELHETEAVELVGYTAMHCVKMEGKERPTISDIVANLERAFDICEKEYSHGTISSGSIGLASD